MQISDGSSCRSRHNRYVDPCNSCQCQVIDRSNGCTALAAQKATGASCLLGMEDWNPERDIQGLCRLHRASSMEGPFSSGSVRLEMSTRTDWPRLEDPLVEVVLHFSELDPSHVQGDIRGLGTTWWSLPATP